MIKIIYTLRCQSHQSKETVGSVKIAETVFYYRWVFVSHRVHGQNQHHDCDNEIG